MNLNRMFKVASVIVITLVSAASLASAAIVPYTENFAASASDWRQADGTIDLAWNAAGGPDASSYGSSSFSFVNQAAGARPAIVRAHDEYGTSGASGGAFVGNWLAEGVTGFSTWVRHNAPVPLNFYARYADPSNSPGAASLEFVPVLPNTWTKLTFNIAFGTPNLFLEGPPTLALYNNVFDSIGHVQIGAETPAALAGNPGVFTFDVDQPTLLPEPTTAALLALAGAGLLLRPRTRVG
jgi:hypothetical protein